MCVCVVAASTARVRAERRPDGADAGPERRRDAEERRLPHWRLRRWLHPVVETSNNSLQIVLTAL